MIKSIRLGDINFPCFLKHIHSPPQIIYYIGDLSGIDYSRAISIVGSRNSTEYAEIVIQKILKELKYIFKDLIIISGMALGVDTLVHKFCLQHNIRTIAVLPLGVNKIVPISNKLLYEAIIKNGGACISEDLQVKRYGKYYYPRRNRIIAGLSMITLVIEAFEDSGAINTANIAFNENRSVYAIPGNITSRQSEGTNKLIMCNKAKILCNIKQISEDLKFDIDHLKLKL